MSEQINRLRWKCRRGMRELDLLLKEFSQKQLFFETKIFFSSIFLEFQKKIGHFRIKSEIFEKFQSILRQKKWGKFFQTQKFFWERLRQF